MAYWESNGHVTDDVTMASRWRHVTPSYSDPNKLRAQYLENSQRYYL